MLDASMPLLPAGVRERAVAGGEVELTATAAAPPTRAALETAAGSRARRMGGAPTCADWRERRARFGGGSFLVGERCSCARLGPARHAGVIDLVLERGGGGSGSGSHSTTRMCIELLLALNPQAGRPISARASERWRSRRRSSAGAGRRGRAHGRRGRRPRENGTRNGSGRLARADLETADVPLAQLLFVDAPPPVHAHVAQALGAPGPSQATIPNGHVIVWASSRRSSGESRADYAASRWTSPRPRGGSLAGALLEPRRA